MKTEVQRKLSWLNWRERPSGLTDQQWSRLHDHLAGEAYTSIAHREGVTVGAIYISTQIAAHKIERRRWSAKYQSRQRKLAGMRAASDSLKRTLRMMQLAMQGRY